MNEKTQATLKKIKKAVPAFLGGAAVAGGVYLIKRYRIVPREGHFIRKADFLRMLHTDARMIMQTPLGEFRVTPLSD